MREKRDRHRVRKNEIESVGRRESGRERGNYIYIYIYIYIKREREREGIIYIKRERGREREREGGTERGKI